MKILSGCGLWAVGLSFAAIAPPEAAAQDTDAAAHASDVQRLDAALEKLAGYARSERKTGAVLNILMGGASVAAGTLVALNWERWETSGSPLLSTLLIAYGGAILFHGVHGLLWRRTTDEQRLVRFREAMKATGPEAQMLARYEGELAAEAQIARHFRIVNGVMYLGLAAGGAAVIGLGAARSFGEHSGAVTVLGVVWTTLGTGLGIMSLASESAWERAWRQYVAGGTAENARSTSRRAPSLAIAPALGPQAVGVSIGGSL